MDKTYQFLLGAKIEGVTVNETRGFLGDLQVVTRDGERFLLVAGIGRLDVQEVKGE